MSDLDIAFDGESLITPDSIASQVFSSAKPVRDEELGEAQAELALHSEGGRTAVPKSD